MSVESFYTLRSYYIADPEGFVLTLNGDSVTSQLYKSLIAQFLLGLEEQFGNISSKLVKMDMDGNIMMSNNSAFFGQTKDDVKNIPSRVQAMGDSEFLVADGLGKKAFILETRATNYVGIVESLFTDTITQEDADFIRVIFGNVNIVINFPQIIWQYNSNKYITSFSLVPVDVVPLSIDNDVIRESDVFIRQGTTITWQNTSASPISIYSGSTTYEQFQLAPDLALYGQDFQSPVLQPGEKYSFTPLSVGEVDYFVYPTILTGKVMVTRNRISARDQFLILENDGLSTPFSSRLIRVDSWGNVLWSFGESYLVKPRDARPLTNGRVIIST